MNVRIVVPRRADGGHRDRLWAFCRAYWERELPWPIVEGADHSDGPFNRSRAINAGAAGDWDVLVILDGDVILDPDTIRAGVSRAHELGHVVLPYRQRRLVNAAGTREILAGFLGSWERWAPADRNRNHCSSCVIVPRLVWDEVHGFDERFEGWGAEDDAFHAACAAVTAVDRLDGSVWHLHHQPSPHHHSAAPTYRSALALAKRYMRPDPEGMRRVLAEDRGADQVVVVVLTNGRRDTLAKTVHSADEMLQGPIGRRLVVGDGCSPAFDGWDTETIRGGGYTRAVAAAWEVALGSGQPWVFWVEDDFTFEQPVDLAALEATMLDEPRLAQLSLLRQPWYPEEVAAGGLIPERTGRGDRFVQRQGPAGPWVEHWAYWTMNPMLMRRSFMAEHRWPSAAGSENRFGRQLFDSDCDPIVGIWGSIDDAPRCVHIGHERAGRGY